MAGVYIILIGVPVFLLILAAFVIHKERRQKKSSVK